MDKVVWVVPVLCFPAALFAVFYFFPDGQSTRIRHLTVELDEARKDRDVALREKKQLEYRCAVQTKSVEAKAKAMQDMRLRYHLENLRREEIGYTKRGLCVICLVETVSVFACVPCGHVCLCAECVELMRKTQFSCPFCRSQCTDYLRLYEARDDDKESKAVEENRIAESQIKKSWRWRISNLFTK